MFKYYNIIIMDTFGYTRLMMAAKTNKTLISYNNKTNINDYNSLHNRYTALHYACIYGNIDILNDLIKLPNIDVNVVDSNNMTPLYLACQFNYVDCVIKLLKHPSINLNIRCNKMNFTPLMICCYNGYVNIYDIFYGYDAKYVESNIGELLLTSSKILGNKLFPILLDMYNNNNINLTNINDINDMIDNNGNNSLHYLCLNEDINNIKLLLSKNKNINVGKKNNVNHTPLFISCYKYNPEMVKIFLDKILNSPCNLIDGLFESKFESDILKCFNYVLKTKNIPSIIKEYFICYELPISLINKTDLYHYMFYSKQKKNLRLKHGITLKIESIDHDLYDIVDDIDDIDDIYDIYDINDINIDDNQNNQNNEINEINSIDNTIYFSKIFEYFNGFFNKSDS